MGRFAPFHDGHARLLKRIVERFGAEEALVLVGSSNSITRRTPYSYKDRVRIIRASFPKIEILPLPDGKPNLEYFDGSTNDIWLDSIERLARGRQEKFVFYGGSKEDLTVLAERFKTYLIIDRYGEGEGLTATEIRKIILEGKIEELKKYVDLNALEMILEKYIKI